MPDEEETELTEEEIAEAKAAVEFEEAQTMWNFLVEVIWALLRTDPFLSSSG